MSEQMKDHERAGLGFDDLTEDDVSLNDLLEDPLVQVDDLKPKHVDPSLSSKESLKKKLTDGSKQLGFVRREATKRRRVSPYTQQFGGKCREGMKPLFKSIGERLNCYDTETLERAILALLEKENMHDLLEEYSHITNG